MAESDALEPATDVYDSVAYQTVLVRAYACIKTALQRRQLDPLRYLVTIDAGLPIFAPRSSHRLHIAYNRFASLSVEADVDKEWMQEEAGTNHDAFMGAVDDMVVALRNKVEASGRPL